MAATETSARASTAVDDLYRRHVGDVYRYTYAVLGNHADAEDVTQTTFVNALRALERGEKPRNAAHWLLAIAHNLVRQRWRQAAARPAEVELAHDIPATAGEDEIELDSLVRALQRIPPAQREALVMRELEGRSYQEISELLSLSTSALETLLFRARRSLAEELENVVTCQSAELAISKRLDGRLGRKERRRLAAHLDDCPECTRLAQLQTRHRRAFKGLAVLPLPVGLALFKGAPAATAAAGLPTIGAAGGGAAFSGAAGSAGTATALGTATASGGGAAAAGGAAAGGTLVGAAAAKVAAVVVAAGVATGVGYEGVKAVRDTPSKPPAAETRARSGAGSRAAPASPSAARPTPPVRARGATAAPGREKQAADPPGARTGRVGSGAAGASSAAVGEPRGSSAEAHERATPTRRRTGRPADAERATKEPGTAKAARGQREKAAAAKARAAAKKLARDGATAGAAATGKPAKTKTEPTTQGKSSSAPGGKQADPGKAKDATPLEPAPTPAPLPPATPDVGGPAAAPPDHLGGQGREPGGGRADAKGTGSGKP